MQHIMNLDQQYYTLTKQGLKRVEFRLNDKKRQSISIGDTIKFINRSNPNDTYIVTVLNLKYENSFNTLINQYDTNSLGFDKHLLISILNKIYNQSDINKYGVVAIEF